MLKILQARLQQYVNQELPDVQAGDQIVNISWIIEKAREFQENIYLCFLEKTMAAHSSALAWRIPWTEEPGGLQSTGLQRAGHGWATPLSRFIDYAKAFDCVDHNKLANS